MLLAEVSGVFNQEYEITRDGSFVAAVTFAGYTEVSTMTVLSQGYRINAKMETWQTVFTLCEAEPLGGNGKVVATTNGGSIEAGGQYYTLHLEWGWFAFRNAKIRHGSGSPQSASPNWGSTAGGSLHVGDIGSIRAVGYWKPDYQINLPDEVPLHVQVFLFWLMMLKKSRATATS